MGRFVTDVVSERIEEIMFFGWGDSPRERFLKVELRRYIPQLTGKTPQEIRAFVDYQRSLYIDGAMPVVGQAIASLNPTFCDSPEAIKIKKAGHQIYTRASVKVNGYRCQLHCGISEDRAYTRQFTQYDLRMFPELAEVINSLPLMIGDAELSNSHFHHLAGFNRVQMRFPKGNKFWPKHGSDGLDQIVLQEYLADQQIFPGGRLSEELELSLIFHGLFAISDPSTWHMPREEQAKHMISLCRLPIDYRLIDSLLDQLGEFIKSKALTNAGIVEQKIIASGKELAIYLEEKEKAQEEGICIVQSIRTESGQPVMGGRSIKIKKYETIDAVLLGLYLKKGRELVPENISGALLGLYDSNLNEYLPAMKVNLDPNGPQIKTAGQRERLIALTQEIIESVSQSIDPDGKVVTLYDAYLIEGAYILRQLIGDDHGVDLEQLLFDLPRGHDLISLLKLYWSHLQSYWSPKKKFNAAETFINENLKLFQLLAFLDKERYQRFAKYFSRARDIKATSAKLIKPQAVIDLSRPVVLEAQVFDLKYGPCAMAAGFHSWYCDSFILTNCFAERVRYDKSTTTDYATVQDLCRRYTARRRRAAKRKNS